MSAVVNRSIEDVSKVRTVALNVVTFVACLARKKSRQALSSGYLLIDDEEVVDPEQSILIRAGMTIRLDEHDYKVTPKHIYNIRCFSDGWN